MMTRGVERADVHAHRIGREDDREQVLDQDQQPERGDEDAGAEGAAPLELLVEEQVDQQPRGRRRHDGGGDRHARAAGAAASARRRRSRRPARRPRRARRGSAASCRRSAPSRARTGRRGCPPRGRWPASWRTRSTARPRPRALVRGLDDLLDLDLAALEHAHLDVHDRGVIGLEHQLARDGVEGLDRLDGVLDPLAVQLARRSSSSPPRRPSRRSWCRCSTAPRRSPRRSCSCSLNLRAKGESGLNGSRVSACPRRPWT